MNRFLAAAPIFLFVLLTAAPSWAPSPGVVFEIETKTYLESDVLSETLTMFVEGPNLALPLQNGEKEQSVGAVIFRGDRGETGEMIVINHEEQYYMVIDEKTIDELSAKIAESTKAMEDAMKNLSPEQRAMMEKMQKEAGGMSIPGISEPPEIEVEKTGETASIAGYPCVKYITKIDGRVMAELWMTDWDNVEGADEAKDVFRRLSAFSEKMMEAVPGGHGANFGPLSQVDFNMGFAVATKTFRENGELSQEGTLKSIRRQEIDLSRFEPPSGYKRQSFGM